MSDTEDKRFDATPAKRRRARNDGNVARSPELTSVAAFGAATLAAIFAVPISAAAALTAVRETATHAATAVAAMNAGMTVDGAAATTVDATAGTPTVSTMIAALACAALVPLGAGALSGAFAAVAQAGGFHVVPPHLDPKRLDPVAGLKRMFSGSAVVALVRAAIAFAAALVAIAPVIRDAVATGAALGSPGAAAALVASAALRACGAAFAIGAIFAGIDYALARRRWLHGLRMSFEELKRDAKENDGDPHARARRKAAHRGVVRGSIGRTRDASFVVVNPTHVAVALRYAPPAVPVPEILVRAVDGVALRVRAIARDYGIPVVENVELARLLYAQGTTGRAIPPETYVAVAHVVAALAREGVLS